MTDQLTTLGFKLARERAKEVERIIVETVEVHLGRVPTDSEVAKNGLRVISGQHEYWMWAGYHLFHIINHKKGFGFDVEKLVYKKITS